MDKAAYIEMFLNEDRHWWFVARRMMIQRILSYYFRVEQERRILEAGCGIGGNLAAVRSLKKNYGKECTTDVTMPSGLINFFLQQYSQAKDFLCPIYHFHSEHQL